VPAAPAIAAGPAPDVAVIGAGVIGLTVACALAEAGASVAVVERGPVAGPQACSWGNTGWIGPGGVVPIANPTLLRQGLRSLADPTGPFGLAPGAVLRHPGFFARFLAACRPGRVARGTAALSELKRGAVAAWRALAEAEEPGFPVLATPKLVAYATQAGLEAGVREAELIRAHGGRVDILDPAEIAGALPGCRLSSVGAQRFPDDGAVDPAAALAALAERARRRGVAILDRTAVTGAEIEHGRLGALWTEAGRLPLGLAVLAAGAESARLGRLFGLGLPLLPGRGIALTVPGGAGAPPMPVLLAEGKVAVTPFGDRLRFAGTLELGEGRAQVDPRRLEGLRRTIGRFLPDLALPAERATWAGLRPVTPDGLPLIGRPSRLDGLLVATGHAMIGMGQAPATARLVTDLVLGLRPTISAAVLAAIDPDRFAPPRRRSRTTTVEAPAAAAAGTPETLP